MRPEAPAPDAHEHDHAGEHPHEHGEDDRPVADRPITGLERGHLSRQPPLDDAAEWREQRLEAARRLRGTQLAAAQYHAVNRGYTPEQTQSVVGALDAFHEQLIALKERVEDGSLRAADLRSQTSTLREEVGASIEEALGVEEAAALKRVLQGTDLGGGW